MKNKNCDKIIRKKTRSLMFLGTGSDVGKSIAAAAFCRIFKKKGFQGRPVQGPEHVQQLLCHGRRGRDRPGPGGYDWLILPGAKNVMEDVAWLKRSGWTRTIRSFADRGGRILGICGGYQLLGKTIRDPLGVESRRKEIKGIGLLPLETVLAGEKAVRKVTGTCFLNRRKVTGYEIHMGRSRMTGKGGSPFLRML